MYQLFSVPFNVCTLKGTHSRAMPGFTTSVSSLFRFAFSLFLVLHVGVLLEDQPQPLIKPNSMEASLQEFLAFSNLLERVDVQYVSLFLSSFWGAFLAW